MRGHRVADDGGPGPTAILLINSPLNQWGFLKPQKLPAERKSLRTMILRFITFIDSIKTGVFIIDFYFTGIMGYAVTPEPVFFDIDKKAVKC